MKVLWTYVLTRLLWYACDFVRWILYYITLHTTNWKASCQMHLIARSQFRSEAHSWLHSIAHSQPAWLTLSSKLSRRSLVHLRVCSQVHSRARSQGRSQLHSMAHSQPAWLYATKQALKTLSSILPSTLSNTLPIALDCTLPACLSVRSQIHSRLHSIAHSLPAWLYAPMYALKSQDAPNLTWLYAPKYAPACSMPIAGARYWAASGRGRIAGFVWWAVFGGRCVAGGVWRRAAEIMTSVDIIVWTISLARPPRQDLMMPHGHGVDNCSLRFRRKGRQFNHGESRSPT